MIGDDALRRAIISGVYPEIDGGQHPIKRSVGEEVTVEADIFAEGHDALSAVLLYRRLGAAEWHEAPMEPLGNDRWRGSFPVGELGRYQYALEAWVDHFKTWRRDLGKRLDAGQDVGVDLLIGAGHVEEAAELAGGDGLGQLRTYAQRLRGERTDAVEAALDPELSGLMARHPDRRFATRHDVGQTVWVEPTLARFSSWYELFPRSASTEPGRHGTFADVEKRLPYVAELGFDVLYLPPIHPIGHAHRKGKNNAVTAEEGDVGSPWAIGGPEGGHKAINPDLGTIEDFERLVRTARGMGIEVAMDIAYQCSPDHPWVREHPEWFRQRPDGTIQYAENPPKKYQDIYPIDFETEAWESLWTELESVVLHWVDHGVRVFRVDNPHTKAFPFWKWMIDRVKQRHPEVIFLSEAFTRPRVMYHLAKVGFTQSYTYFAWRNAKWELEQYLTELTRTEVREYFRPNFWPNTPDILPEFLQVSGRPGFVIRLMLAATLGASYGIYGPAFELQEAQPREHGSEEYLNSEKYQLRHWDLGAEHSIREIIARVNRVRHEHPALQSNESLRFHPTTNDALICYSKSSGDDTVLCVVNVDPHNTRSGFVDLDLEALGVDPERPFQTHDLLSGARYLWHGSRNYVELNPHSLPGHVFAIRRTVRREQDFEYYL